MSAGVLSASGPWIISRRDDLVWLQGGVVAGLALCAFFVTAPPSAVVLAVFLWGVLFDGTHVWGTYARSYLAPDAASRAALPGRWSWAVFGIGPAVALLDAGLAEPGGLFAWFLLLAYLWAYWHLVRQHYGFLRLYRRREGAADANGARLDTALLWLGCLYPYVRFSLSDGYAATGLPRLTPPALIPLARLALDAGFVVAMTALLVTVLSGRVEPRRLAQRHLLLALVIGFHAVVFAALDDLLAILATLTIFHNLQYHRIVWHYERGHGRVPSGSLARYLALGLALGLVWYGARVLGAASAPSTLTRNVLIGLGWGVAFHHYLVDGRIWRVGRSPAVAQALARAAA
ncbi:MAG TPA: hypothetical protein VGT02_05510 [Methylomirabilota bacterium]|jgi:hypothetical protein|nr:hypothetical protein [Methylomirabilota bacterium]